MHTLSQDSPSIDTIHYVVESTELKYIKRDSHLAGGYLRIIEYVLFYAMTEYVVGLSITDDEYLSIANNLSDDALVACVV